tara:strand:+ start:294 stop:482 length:189 start_codon:yes stop_codon:yes gene_type:complete
MGQVIQFPNKTTKKVLETILDIDFSELEKQTQKIEEMSIELEKQSEELVKQTERILKMMDVE